MKRGMILVDNSLELILVTIFVALVIGGGILGYSKYVESNEQKNAQSFLDSILSKYDSLNEGESNTFIFQGFKGADSWYLRSWGVSNPARPEKCFFESCLCVCKGNFKVNGAQQLGVRPEDCQERGFCRNVSRAFDISYTYPERASGYTKVGETITPGQTGGDLFYSMLRVPCMPLSRLAFEVSISKSAYDGRISSISYVTSYPLHCDLKWNVATS